MENALAADTELGGYRIKGILGHGGFGITYGAIDTKLEMRVAIKEYYPGEFARRESDGTVQAKSPNSEELYTWGLTRFLDEAKTLARFQHPNIVQVLTFFEQNNTAYMVMRYEEGRDLKQLLKKEGDLSQQQLLDIVIPLLDGLQTLHADGFIHRDIKPGNIFIRKDGSPVLLDFGSSRQALGEQTKTITSLLTPGYAPLEQYLSTSTRQGPWTDIYGMGAVMYRIVTGKVPDHATDRSYALQKEAPDPLPPAAEVAKQPYDQGFLDAIDWAVNVMEKDRPQSVEEWRDKLLSLKPSRSPNQSEAPSEDPQPNPKEPDGRFTLYQRNVNIAAALILVLALGSVGYAQRHDIYRWLPTGVQNWVQSLRSNDINQQKLEATTKKDIPSLLKSAVADFRKNRLLLPAGNNAYEKYMRVFDLDPTNTTARDGINRIADRYLQFTENRIREKSWDKARELLSRARKVSPLHPKIYELQVQIEGAEAKARQQRMRDQGFE